jgi:D-glycero-alpha-D-manno-heptose 1-phosphate guanylyltransferase
VSNGLPKPLIPVNGRPFIQYVLDSLVDAGVPTIYLAVSYRWQLIRSELGDRYRGVDLHYSVEDEPLGTGGAILNCYREHSLQTAFVLNGDTLFRVHLAGLLSAHTTTASQITIALRHVSNTSRYGAVSCNSEHQVLDFKEKNIRQPGLINGGIYIVERRALERWHFPRAFSFEIEFLQQHCTALKPLGVVENGYFIDIGVPDDLNRAQRELTNAC